MWRAADEVKPWRRVKHGIFTVYFKLASHLTSWKVWDAGSSHCWGLWRKTVCAARAARKYSDASQHHCCCFSSFWQINTSQAAKMMMSITFKHCLYQIGVIAGAESAMQKRWWCESITGGAVCLRSSEISVKRRFTGGLDGVGASSFAVGSTFRVERGSTELMCEDNH